MSTEYGERVLGSVAAFSSVSALEGEPTPLAVAGAEAVVTLEFLEGSVSSSSPIPQSEREGRGSGDVREASFLARAGLASPTMGIRARWGGLCRAVSPT